MPGGPPTVASVAHGARGLIPSRPWRSPVWAVPWVHRVWARGGPRVGCRGLSLAGRRQSPAAVSPTQYLGPRGAGAGCSGLWGTLRQPARRPFPRPRGRFHARHPSLRRPSGAGGASPRAWTAPRKVGGLWVRGRVSATAGATRSPRSRSNAPPWRRRSARPGAPRFTPGSPGRARARAGAGWRSVHGSATGLTPGRTKPGGPMGSASGAGSRTNRQAGLRSSQTRRCRRRARGETQPTTPSSRQGARCRGASIEVEAHRHG